MNRRRFVTLVGFASFFPACIKELMAQASPQVEIPSTIERLPQALASDFAKAGLESAVRAVYDFRRQEKPLGYENKSDWQARYEQVYAEFQKHLWSDDLGRTAEAVLKDKETIATFRASYDKNEATFSAFSKAVAAQGTAPHYLRAARGDLLVRAQLYFAAVLRGAGPNQLKSAVSITAIWPYCGE